MYKTKCSNLTIIQLIFFVGTVSVSKLIVLNLTLFTFENYSYYYFFFNAPSSQLQSFFVCLLYPPAGTAGGYFRFSSVTPPHSGPGRAQNWTKTKISIYQNIIFLWAKSKDDILDIMCLNLFELKIIISTLKITSKSNL